MGYATEEQAAPSSLPSTVEMPSVRPKCQTRKPLCIMLQSGWTGFGNWAGLMASIVRKTERNSPLSSGDRPAFMPASTYMGNWPGGHIYCGDFLVQPEAVMWKAIDKLSSDEAAMLAASEADDRAFMNRQLAAFAEEIS